MNPKAALGGFPETGLHEAQSKGSWVSEWTEPSRQIILEADES
jgi:hypothetical protein